LLQIKWRFNMSFTRHLATCAILIVLALAASCSYGPSPVRQPSIDASDAGELAMELYDTNADGKVTGEELDKSPALKAALTRLDTDKDRGVSADEVTARVNAWKAMKTGMASLRCQVRLDGQALPGAKVTFEPEEFLGDEIKMAVGVSNPFGDVAPSIPPEDRPDPTLPGGAHFGLYTVRISKDANGRETLPARYNTETTLGEEVSYDNPAMSGTNVIVFELQSTQ
jgi:hypothetical protein